jgi:hypothetical protein
MKILIFNNNLFYLENDFQFYETFLLINSKIIETNKLITIFLFVKRDNKNLQTVYNFCNISLNVLYEVAMEYYKINVLNKPLTSSGIAYKPFFYKKRT